MKTLRMIGLMAMLCFIMPAFVSCDKDDDEPTNSDNVVGTYVGNMTATVTVAMGPTQQVWDNIEMDGSYEFKIVKQSKEGKVTVEIPECTYIPPISDKPETIPALTVTNVEVEDEGNGIYSLDKDSHELPVDGKQYTVEIFDYDDDDSQGTTINGRNIKLVYSVVPGVMPGNIKFTFTGTLK